MYPHMVVPLFVGRDKSIAALEEVMDKGQELLFLAQKDADTNDPNEEDLYKIGTLGKVLQLLKLPDGTVKVLVEGLKRAKVEDLIPHEKFLEAKVEVLSEEKTEDKALIALSRQVVSRFEDFVKLNTKVASEVVSSLKDINDPSKIADTVASQMTGNVSEKQKILETVDVSERVKLLLLALEKEVRWQDKEKEVLDKVRQEITKEQANNERPCSRSESTQSG